MRIQRPSELIAPPTPPEPAASEPLQPARVEGPSPFASLMRGLGRQLDRGEALTENAIRGGGGGRGLSPQALLALQAGIYRYVEAVDLVTKLVDRTTQAVKTTLQNQ
jgi:hypothetical protein